jgi:hypothetical protein
METLLEGQLVTVKREGGALDGIVFDTPSAGKVVVAVMDPARGPSFRTVHPRTLTERTDAGPDDPALHALIRRTPAPIRGSGRAGAGPGVGHPGHSRAAGHRTTGK